MSKTLLLFPHQLFAPSLFPSDATHIVFIEDPLFFGDKKYFFNFNKNKLVFHRATVDYYLQELKKAGYKVTHHIFSSDLSTTKTVSQISGDIIYYDVADYELHKRIEKGNPKCIQLQSPMFLNSTKENEDYFHPEGKVKKTYRMHNFYQFQRKRLNILIDKDEQPVGGQWSFDENNRKKVPTKLRDSIPNDPKPNINSFVTEATKWVEEHFPDNIGTTDSFFYPVTRTESEAWLQDFLQEKYAQFGDYEDAVDSEHSRLWHSILSPLLNCGLLTPEQVINEATKYYTKHDTPLNSHEGFIRQIIGWREYMKALYDLRGVDLRNSNDWKQTRKLSGAWYTGSTGITPVDKAIKDALQTGYNHHIERLMVIGGVMFTSGLHPNEVYKWFMELYIDAYDWVMVGNVYGMSQDSFDGLITTKPYFSGSNYIFKMSNYKKSHSQEWADIMDALYWSFIIENAEKLQGNIRWAMMVRNVEKMDQNKIDNYLQTKKDFLESL